MGFGVFEYVQFHVLQQLVVSVDHGLVDLDAFANTGIFETLCHTDAVGFVGYFFADFIEILLSIGILDMGKQLGVFSHQKSFLHADRLRSKICDCQCKISFWPPLVEG